MPNNKDDPRKNKGPRDDINALERNLLRAQESFTKSAEEIGYQLEVVQEIKPYWESVTEDLPQGSVASGAAIISTWRDHSEDWVRESERHAQEITVFSFTAATTGTSSNAIEYIYSSAPAIDHQKIRRLTMQRQKKHFVESCLHQIGSELASTYSTLWGYMHLPALDPNRGPLYLMRQVFDGFLDHLAPDELVMAQDGFVPDAPLKESNGKGVTRTHRIAFLADTKVQDEATKETLLQTTRTFSDIYGELNHAHNRKSLDEEKARDAVYAGDALLLHWLIALGY